MYPIFWMGVSTAPSPVCPAFLTCVNQFIHVVCLCEWKQVNERAGGSRYRRFVSYLSLQVVAAAQKHRVRGFRTSVSSSSELKL